MQDDCSPFLRRARRPGKIRCVPFRSRKTLAIRGLGRRRPDSVRPERADFIPSAKSDSSVHCCNGTLLELSQAPALLHRGIGIPCRKPRFLPEEPKQYAQLCGRGHHLGEPGLMQTYRQLFRQCMPLFLTILVQSAVKSFKKSNTNS